MLHQIFSGPLEASRKRPVDGVSIVRRLGLWLTRFSCILVTDRKKALISMPVFETKNEMRVHIRSVRTCRNFRVNSLCTHALSAVAKRSLNQLDMPLSLNLNSQQKTVTCHFWTRRPGSTTTDPSLIGCTQRALASKSPCTMTHTTRMQRKSWSWRMSWSGLKPTAVWTKERFRAGQTANKNMAQTTYWNNGTNQSVKSNPRVRIEAGWYLADCIINTKNFWK